MCFEAFGCVFEGVGLRLIFWGLGYPHVAFDTYYTRHLQRAFLEALCNFRPSEHPISYKTLMNILSKPPNENEKSGRRSGVQECVFFGCFFSLGIPA